MINLDRLLVKAKTYCGNIVIGYYVYSKIEDGHYIIENNGEELQFPIFEDTICPCTGEKDIEGNLIFENDKILRLGNVEYVKYFEKYHRFGLSQNNEANKLPMIITNWNDLKVVGNKFDETFC